MTLGDNNEPRAPWPSTFPSQAIPVMSYVEAHDAKLSCPHPLPLPRVPFPPPRAPGPSFCPVAVHRTGMQVFMDYRFNPNMPHPDWYSPVDATATANMWAADKRDSTAQTLLDNSWYVPRVRMHARGGAMF